MSRPLPPSYGANRMYPTQPRSTSTTATDEPNDHDFGRSTGSFPSTSLQPPVQSQPHPQSHTPAIGNGNSRDQPVRREPLNAQSPASQPSQHSTTSRPTRYHSHANVSFSSISDRLGTTIPLRTPQSSVGLSQGGLTKPSFPSSSRHSNSQGSQRGILKDTGHSTQPVSQSQTQDDGTGYSANTTPNGHQNPRTECGSPLHHNLENSEHTPSEPWRTVPSAARGRTPGPQDPRGIKRQASPDTDRLRDQNEAGYRPRLSFATSRPMSQSIPTQDAAHTRSAHRGDGDYQFFSSTEVGPTQLSRALSAPPQRRDDGDTLEPESRITPLMGSKGYRDFKARLDEEVAQVPNTAAKAVFQDRRLHETVAVFIHDNEKLSEDNRQLQAELSGTQREHVIHKKTIKAYIERIKMAAEANHASVESLRSLNYERYKADTSQQTEMQQTLIETKLVRVEDCDGKLRSVEEKVATWRQSFAEIGEDLKKQLDYKELHEQALMKGADLKAELISKERERRNESAKVVGLEHRLQHYEKTFNTNMEDLAEKVTYLKKHMEDNSPGIETALAMNGELHGEIEVLRKQLKEAQDGRQNAESLLEATEEKMRDCEDIFRARGVEADNLEDMVAKVEEKHAQEIRTYEFRVRKAAEALAESEKLVENLQKEVSSYKRLASDCEKLRSEKAQTSTDLAVAQDKVEMLRGETVELKNVVKREQDIEHKLLLANAAAVEKQQQLDIARQIETGLRTEVARLHLEHQNQLVALARERTDTYQRDETKVQSLKEDLQKYQRALASAKDKLRAQEESRGAGGTPLQRFLNKNQAPGEAELVKHITKEARLTAEAEYDGRVGDLKIKSQETSKALKDAQAQNTALSGEVWELQQKKEQLEERIAQLESTSSAVSEDQVSKSLDPSEPVQAELSDDPTGTAGAQGPKRKTLVTAPFKPPTQSKAGRIPVILLDSRRRRSRRLSIPINGEQDEEEEEGQPSVPSGSQEVKEMVDEDEYGDADLDAKMAEIEMPDGSDQKGKEGEIPQAEDSVEEIGKNVKGGRRRKEGRESTVEEGDESPAKQNRRVAFEEGDPSSAREIVYQEEGRTASLPKMGALFKTSSSSSFISAVHTYGGRKNRSADSQEKGGAKKGANGKAAAGKK